MYSDLTAQVSQGEFNAAMASASQEIEEQAREQETAKEAKRSSAAEECMSVPDSDDEDLDELGMDLVSTLIKVPLQHPLHCFHPTAFYSNLSSGATFVSSGDVSVKDSGCLGPEMPKVLS
jgi:hypothetical protein